MDCVRLALVNLYKVSPKQAHQNRFFLCVFTIYSYNRNPIYKLSTAFKRTKHVEGDHDLIVRARLQFGMHGLSCLFSLTPLRGCPRNSGQGKFSTFTDFSNNFSESRPLYPMNKYHIYLDQIFYFYFLRGGFYCNLKTTQFAFEDSII